MDDATTEDATGPKGLLTAGATTKKNKKKKNVSWTEESKLRVYHYFEMDETERGEFNCLICKVSGELLFVY